MDKPHPSLTIVAGRPGSGKTTLAHALAKAIRCPAICRDEVKEGLVNSLKSPPADKDALQRQANDAFFQSIQLLLHHGITLIAEAAFQHRVWAPNLEPLFPLAMTRIVLCTIPPELAHSRHIERGLADPERERFHADHAVRAARQGRQVPIGNYDPPNFNIPTLIVDTTQGYRPQFETILSFARGESIADTAKD